MSKQFILVSKLNKIDFETADKELNKYIQGLKEISYKEIHNGTTEIATYSNEERTKVFDVNILYYKDSGLYDLSIYQLMECREIKVTLVNKDSFYTKITAAIMIY